MKKTKVFLCLSLVLFGVGMVLSLRADIGWGQEAAPLFSAVGMVLLLIGALSRRYVRVGSKMESVGKKRMSAVSFQDVAANEMALESLREVVDMIRQPEKYERLGARMPRGLLLYGPPGTGKTLLARALAGEAGVPFLAASGSDFVEMYAGMGARRVRALFEKARKAKKCVVFIDEIDALGKKRGDTSSDEREQTLNALLAEMSGFHSAAGIHVVAATNRREAMDPALLRPGRFDRQIEVGLPTLRQREQILTHYLAGKPVSREVSAHCLARDTAFFSGAKLEYLINEAALSAARRGSEFITQSDVESAYVMALAGQSTCGVSADPAQKFLIAMHEAAHALTAYLLTPEKRISRVTILPAGGAAGYNVLVPQESAVVTRKMLMSEIQTLLAGRAAEWCFFGKDSLTAGAENDLQRAGELANTMCASLGMGKETGVAMRVIGEEKNAASEARALLNELFEQVAGLLQREKERLFALADELVLRETLSHAEVAEVMARGRTNSDIRQRKTDLAAG